MDTMPPMRLADFLQQSEMSDADFGRLIGVERQAIYRYRLGHRFPGREVLQKIADVTDGQVTANDFIDRSQPHKARASA